jgi:hypothetical protein
MREGQSKLHHRPDFAPLNPGYTLLVMPALVAGIHVLLS